MTVTLYGYPDVDAALAHLHSRVFEGEFRGTVVSVRCVPTGASTDPFFAGSTGFDFTLEIEWPRDEVPR